MNQFNIAELIKAIAFLLLIFLLVFITSKCEKIVKQPTTTKQDEKIAHIDSLIVELPYTLPESTRTIFLDNYQKFR